MEQQPASCEVQNLVPLYALGALDDAERGAFEDHLRECSVCESDLRSLGAVTDALAICSAANPPASLKQRLMDKVRGTPRVPGILLDQQGLLISRSAEMAWEPMAPGIVFKPLYNDTARAYNTFLVRMDGGARYPSHQHKDTEELFVLSGDLNIAGISMHTGDYCRADAETVHGETFSESGCLFLLMASEHNQLLA
jgi:quercetin dioxygenase-like cupin family protein